jgi:hypothetical protein
MLTERVVREHAKDLVFGNRRVVNYNPIALVRRIRHYAKSVNTELIKTQMGRFTWSTLSEKLD